MKEFKAGKNEAGQRLDKYLKKILPNASMGFIYKMLRKKNIKLNDKKASGTEMTTKSRFFCQMIHLLSFPSMRIV